jgi:DNA-binding transcriptional ArsR family regulator
MSAGQAQGKIVQIDRCPRVVDPARVAAVREQMPEEDTVHEVAGAFGVLAEPARLRIVLALLEAGELCVCDIAASADVSETSASQHLRVLRASRTVRNRRDGRIVYYSLADGHIRLLLDIALEHTRHGPA